MFGKFDDDFLIASEAAAKLRMAKRTLDNYRWKGAGPKFRRHGGRIVYRQSDLLAWSEERAARLTAPKARHGRNSQLTHDRHSRHLANGSDLAEAKRPQTVLEHDPERSDRIVHDDKPNAGKRRLRDRQSA